MNVCSWETRALYDDIREPSKFVILDNLVSCNRMSHIALLANLCFTKIALNLKTYPRMSPLKKWICPSLLKWSQLEKLYIVQKCFCTPDKAMGPNFQMKYVIAF